MSPPVPDMPDLAPPDPHQGNWQALPDLVQAALAARAMRHASLIIAEQAELFGVQFRAGTLQDRGAADALALFAALLRETSLECLSPVGSA